MSTGPVEILVISFPENRFDGSILPRLAEVVENGTITIVDELFVRVDADGEVSFLEIEDAGLDETSALGRLAARIDGLISDDDVDALVEGLAPNSSAAILVFEHTWSKPLASAVRDAGGVMLDSVRVPGSVVDEVMAAMSETTDTTD